MMSSLFLLDEWIVVGVLTVLLAIFTEVGYRVGRHQADREGGSESYLTHEVSALGVLALLLGFTFSMTAQRFELRRDLILVEANAIGTAALRGQLLPQPYADQTHGLFKEYAKVRIELFDAGVDEARRSVAIGKAEDIQDKIWKLAHDVLNVNRLDVGTGLFIEAVNDVIDAHERRITAFTYHAPDAIYYLIYGVGMFAFALSGVAAGVNRSRSRAPTFIMVLLVSSVVLFIADLDRPQRGMLTIGDQSLRDVSRSLEKQEVPHQK
jgi:hypothetical protein